MDPLLANLTKLPGVIAAGVFANNDGCVGFAATEAGYEPVILLTAIQAAEEALNVFRTAEGMAEAFALSLELEHGLFVYRRCGMSRLGVIANAGINLAVLEVAVNAATLKLSGGQADPPFPAYNTMTGMPPQMGGMMPQGMAMMPPHMAGMMPPQQPQNTMPQPRATPSQPMPVSRVPAGSHSSVSRAQFQSGGSSSGVTDAWAPDELMLNGLKVRGSVGPAVMQHVLKALFRYVGAHAKAIIVEELSRLSATPATVMPMIFTDFIYNVASRIPDPGVQDEFIDIALGDRK